MSQFKSIKNLYSYTEPVLFLKDFFQELKDSKSVNSYRDFSKYLGFGETNYSHLLITGKRSFSKNVAEKISEALGLEDEFHKYLIAICQYSREKNPEKKASLLEGILKRSKAGMQHPLSKEQKQFFSKWYHAVIFEALSIESYAKNPELIVKKLRGKLTQKHLQHSLKILGDLGIVEYDKEAQKYVKNETNFITPKEIRSLIMTQFHKEMIQQAQEALFAIKGENREMSCITLAVDEEFLKEVKVDIQKFLINIIEKSKSRPKTESVIQLNFQLFPFLQEGKVNEG